MLIYFNDSKGISGGKCHQLNTSLSIQQNIKNHFPNGFDNEVTDIIINGEKINPLEYDLSRQATIFDDIRIVNRQQGDPFTWIAIAVAVLAAVTSYILAPKPKIPNSIGEQKQSSNNQLTGQTNIARLYQAKPDIYGCRRVYPDIVTPALTEFIDNVKYIEHLFCIGVGYYQLDKFKYDNTLLNKINGTTYQVYEPGDLIPEIRYQFASAEVDGQELTPPNLSDEILHEDEYKNFVSYNSNNGRVTITLNEKDDATYLQNLITPVQINFTINADVTSRYRNTQAIEKNTNIVYRAILQSVSLNNNNQLVLTGNQVTLIRYEKSIQGDVISTVVNTSYLKVVHTGGVYTDAFILPESGSEIWVELSYPRGLQGYVELNIIWWKIDDYGNEIAGTRENQNYSKRMNTYEVQNETIKIKPYGGKAKYAAIIGRVNNGKSDLTDQVQVNNVYTVDYDYNYQAKDTLIFIRTRATSHATSLKELKFNVEATRKTISYNSEVGQVNYELSPSRSFADAVLHQYIAVYGRSKNELDLSSLYDIDARIKLVDERLGYFDFSFDDIDISLGQRIETICNAARVFVNKDGAQWRFVRNEEKPRPVAMFNSHNLVDSGTGGTVQKKSSLPSSYNGVQVEYVDSSKDRIGGTDKKAYINLKIENGQIVNGFASRPNKIELAGCCNEAQAMNRAQLEVRRLIYERTIIEDEALQDANYVSKGDLVLWSDTWDETIVSGEVVNIIGNKFYVDQKLQLDSSKQYRVAITNKNGYPSNWIDIASYNKDSFTANYSDAYLANNLDIQMGSIFIITEIISEEPTEFLLTEKQFNDGTYKINLTNYDSRIYEYDRESGFFIS